MHAFKNILPFFVGLIVFACKTCIPIKTTIMFYWSGRYNGLGLFTLTFSYSFNIESKLTSCWYKDVYKKIQRIMTNDMFIQKRDKIAPIKISLIWIPQA